jgi:uncharacterized protein (DUF952 family)
MAGMRVLHLAPADLWERAVESGSYRGSTRDHDLAHVGFVHASTAGQLPAVIAGWYADSPLDDHVVLVIDAPTCDASGSPVRWEMPDDSVQLFPHIYGPVPVSAVVAVLPISRGAGGQIVMPAVDGMDVLDAPPVQ